MIPIRYPAIAALAVLLAPSPASASDPFEIQVYDGTANAPHTFGLELHLNRFATGHGTAEAPELPLRGQLHATLEPSFGLFSWWEIGAYLQSAVRVDGQLDYAGVKLRSKFVTPPSFHAHLRLGLNVELSVLPETYDRNRLGGELRPIVAWEGSSWLLAFNPIVGVPLGAPGFHQGPTFEPALKIARGFAETLAVGVEYYGDVGPIAAPEPLRQQGHSLFGVIDILALKGFEVDLGLGAGLTPASAGLVGKVILGYTFEQKKAAP